MSAISRAAPRLRAPMRRSELFFGLFLLAALNSFSTSAVGAVAAQGALGAVAGLFGISAIIWAALLAGLKILRDDRGADPLAPGDRWIAAAVIASVLVPAATASMAGLTAAASWAVATSAVRSPLRRAGLVFLAMTGALLWGRLLLAVFSRPLLDLDAMFVSGLIGAEQRGNMLWLEGGATRLAVAPGCSSMQGLSLALLFWVTVNQLFEVRFDRRAALWCLAALAATVAINVLRIGAMLRFPEHLDAIHHGWGFHLSMYTTMFTLAAICLYAARREVFSRA